jgi:hypothetical protein
MHRHMLETGAWRHLADELTHREYRYIEVLLGIHAQSVHGMPGALLPRGRGYQIGCGLSACLKNLIRPARI